VSDGDVHSLLYTKAIGHAVLWSSLAGRMTGGVGAPAQAAYPCRKQTASRMGRQPEPEPVTMMHKPAHIAVGRPSPRGT